MATTVLSPSPEAARAGGVRDKGSVGCLAGIVERLSRSELFKDYERAFSETIKLPLALRPLSCAHWDIIRGWAEPHFSSSFGLVPPGVMVVYTPRDEHEVAVCRSLFWVSYNFSLSERRKNFAESNAPWFGVTHNSNIQEPVGVVE